jgi:hypothetical protein
MQSVPPSFLRYPLASALAKILNGRTWHSFSAQPRGKRQRQEQRQRPAARAPRPRESKETLHRLALLAWLARPPACACACLFQAAQPRSSQLKHHHHRHQRNLFPPTTSHSPNTLQTCRPRSPLSSSYSVGIAGMQRPRTERGQETGEPAAGGASSTSVHATPQE